MRYRIAISAAKAMSKKRVDLEATELGRKLDKRMRINEDDFDLDLSKSVLESILSILFLFCFVFLLIML